MLNAKKTNVKYRLTGVVLFCVVLFGSLFLAPDTAQAARGHRGGRGFSSRSYHRPAPRRYYRPAPRPYYRRHYRPYRPYRRGTDWVNLGWTLGNVAWSAVNAARTPDTVVIEKPVYVVPNSYDYDDDLDYRILRNWDYTPNTTTTRTEVIICP